MTTTPQPLDGSVPPGAAVGVVGGGQLGRMLALAARAMGYRVHVFAPDANDPAAQVADRTFAAPYDDDVAVREFAQSVDVVTFEFENIPPRSLEVIEATCRVSPSAAVLGICRDRCAEKSFLSDLGVEVAPWAAVESVEDLALALAKVGRPSILKSATLGYDGKGQARIDDDTDATDAYASLGTTRAVLETVIEFDLEASVIVARGLDGATRVYPPFENDHVDHILDVTVVPARIPPSVATEAVAVAERVAAGIDLVGVLCVELFVVLDGPGGPRLLVNELAPRPHNSGHVTIEASKTSQFEQQLRAVCGLALGDVEIDRPAAMANLLGELWSPSTPHFVAALGDEAVKLHLYGKRDARPGRKMGHLVALADSADAAVKRVLQARSALRSGTTEGNDS